MTTTGRFPGWEEKRASKADRGGGRLVAREGGSEYTVGTRVGATVGKGGGGGGRTSTWHPCSTTSVRAASAAGSSGREPPTGSNAGPLRGANELLRTRTCPGDGAGPPQYRARCGRAIRAEAERERERERERGGGGRGAGRGRSTLADSENIRQREACRENGGCRSAQSPRMRFSLRRARFPRVAKGNDSPGGGARKQKRPSFSTKSILQSQEWRGTAETVRPCLGTDPRSPRVWGGGQDLAYGAAVDDQHGIG